MNKKFLIGLFLISLIVLNGGCGGSSSNNFVTPATNVNEALKGTWSSSDGTSTITGTNTDSDELDAFVEAFGEVPDEVLKQYKAETVESVKAPVTRVMAVFDDCNITESNGTAKLTAIVTISNDNAFLPILFNDVSLSTKRNGTNEWTATTSNGDTLSIKMTSEEQISLSGKVRYLDYDCEFSTVINKNQSNSINPRTILGGTWNLDGTQGGGYLADESEIISAVVPESVSMFFKNTGEEDSTLMKSFYSLRMKTSSSENPEDISLLQDVTPETEGTLSQVYGNVYKFQETNGDESIIFVENTDEIFMFRVESKDNDGETCIFLPLKKVAFDIEEALKKNWTATEGDGGGYAKFNLANPNDDPELASLISLLDTVSLTIQNGTLNFSGVTLNDDDTITATLGINATFLFTSKGLEILGIEGETETVSDSSSYTMRRSGNFLEFEDNDGSVYKISFISDTELFLSTNYEEEGTGEGELVMRFHAN